MSGQRKHVAGFAPVAAVAGALLLVAGAFATTAAAQDQRLPITWGSRPFVATTVATYEDYKTVEANASQFSSTLFLEAPLGRDILISLRAGHAVVLTDGAEQLTGFDDLQLSLGGGRRFGRSSLLVSFSANLPSGKRELQPLEFDATIPLSYNFFDFRVPSFGQAAALSSGAALAVSPIDNLAIGAGVSFTIYGGFKPIVGMTDRYRPGNELLITAGVEIGLSEQTTVSGDATFTTFADDKLGEQTIFEAGPKIVAAVQLTSHFDFNTLTVLVRRRSHSDSRILVAQALVADRSLTLPTQSDAQLRFGWRVARSVTLELLAAGRLFEGTPLFTEKTAVDFGLRPALRLSTAITAAPLFVYTAGDIEGFEAGLTLSAQW